MTMTVKEHLKHMIDYIPDQASFDDVMYELCVIQKIEKGLQAADEGRTLSHEEAKKRLLSRFMPHED